jgi:hypothetical protein
MRGEYKGVAVNTQSQNVAAKWATFAYFAMNIEFSQVF